MFWGAWERRWIADDGLIVLRTVRNLLAGNGPVFNAGERVEANTSTAWTYIVYAFGWLTQIRLEYVVLTIALVLSTAARWCSRCSAPAPVPRWVGAGGGRCCCRPVCSSTSRCRPPVTSPRPGLESCLVIFWIALLWLLLVRWAQATDAVAPPSMPWSLLFVAGLGPLVRPEMAILACWRWR